VGLPRELVEGVAPEVAAQVRQAAEVLSAAGATVTECSIPELAYGLPAYYVLAPAEASSNLSRYDGVRYGIRVDGEDVEAMMRATRAAGFGPEVKRRIMLGTYALSAGYYDAYYGQAQKVRTLIIKAFADAYRHADVLLGATTPSTAFPIGAKVDDPMAMYLSDVCTVPSNLAGHPAISIPFGAEVKRRIMLGTYALSAGYYDAYYAQAQRVRTMVMAAFERAYVSVDVLLGATAPTTAFALGAKVDDPMAMYMNDVCTIPSNLSGHPAVSVPFGVGDDGLPVGVQVLAPALQEALLFRVAGAVEAAAP
jgi:Asp-tRNA(Asn)/Glu-tRNA(Gln) amidotransferase A subunit family amidase